MAFSVGEFAMRIRLSILLIAACGLVIWACGSSDGSRGIRGGTGGTGALSCDTLDDPPPGCDDPCSSDSECTDGTYCLDGRCFAQCTPDEGCNQNATCSLRGRCMLVQGTGGAGGSGNVGGSNACQSVRVTPSRSIPNVMFLVDQSRSMDGSFSGDIRWDAAHDAITNVVSQLDPIVRFGLTTYTSYNESNDNVPVVGPCPQLPIQIPFDNDTPSDITDPSAFPGSYPGGEDTPTGDSIDALVSFINGAPPPDDGPTIIVLATDGLPDSCENPDPDTTATEDQALGEAVAAAKRAFDVHQIQTFILSVGPGVTDAHLQEMANVGIGLPGDTTGPGAADFWKATNSDQLAQAFGDIIGASISCDIQMQERFVDPVKACAEGDVTLDGAALDCPDDNGWRVKPGADDVIELLGTACDRLKSGDVEFSAEFPCGTVVVQ